MSFNHALAPGRFPVLALIERLRALNHDIAGDIVTADDPAWDSARQAWALAVDQRPAAVALPQSPEDIVTIVNFAPAGRGSRLVRYGGMSPCPRLSTASRPSPALHPMSVSWATRWAEDSAGLGAATDWPRTACMRSRW